MTSWPDGWERPRSVGEDLLVPLVGGEAARYVNLDHAASTPALETVWVQVEHFLPWYSSVHRGTGLKSKVATAAYEGSRQALRQFLGARPEDAVVFTRNTTDAINMLARCLPQGTMVIGTRAEHHANLLPWRQLRSVELPVPRSPAELLDRLETALKGRRADGEVLVVVTGASNVTGEVWPLLAISALAHRHGARVFVDAAQLAPHRPVEMAALGLDWVAVSGHKLYAPFGCGALVGRRDWLEGAGPYLLGGGAVEAVSEDDVSWAALPGRHEGGSPNVIGAIALASACRYFSGLDRERAIAHDRLQSSVLQGALEGAHGVEVYRTWGAEVDRVPVRAFGVPGYRPAEVAAMLSAEHGIGVRSGSFCAHPLLAHLAKSHRGVPSGCGGTIAGAVRASVGVTSGADEIERLACALERLVREGPRWSYRSLPDGSVEPDPDDRPQPELLLGFSGLSALDRVAS